MRRRLARQSFVFLILSSSAFWMSDASADSTTSISSGTDVATAATIQSISGKTTVQVKGTSGARSASRGDKIQTGDAVSTETETVVLLLPKGNEIQIAPHTTIQFEEVADNEGKRDILLLQNGIVWGLVAVGHSLSDPFYLRTAEATIGVPAASFVVEYIPGTHSFSVLTLEGNVKVAPSIGELSDVKKSIFVSSTFRSYSIGSKIGQPKKFKRNLLISYLARKAKDLAQDMTNRGNRLLTGIAKKNTPTNNEDEITWNNLPPQQAGGTTSANPNGMGGGTYNPNAYRSRTDASAQTGATTVVK